MGIGCSRMSFHFHHLISWISLISWTCYTNMMKCIYVHHRRSMTSLASLSNECELCVRRCCFLRIHCCRIHHHCLHHYRRLRLPMVRIPLGIQRVISLLCIHYRHCYHLSYSPLQTEQNKVGKFISILTMAIFKFTQLPYETEDPKEFHTHN